MTRTLKHILFAAVVLFLAWNVFAAYKFPPPEFDTGYTVPLNQPPDGRPGWYAYVDVAVLAAFLALAAWLSLKKRSRNGLVALSVASLIYFGFWKRGCVCSIGSIQNVTLALFNGSYALPFTVLAFFALPLLTALFYGRAFCSGVCPQGAVQDLLLIKWIKIPRWLDRGLSLFAYLYLGLAVLFAATDTMFIICKFDPFVSFFRVSGQFYLVTIGVIFLLLSMFIGRPYCRYACPYGVLLKFFSMFSKHRVTVSPAECINCALCDEACPYDAIRGPKDSKEEK
jgi:NosR/NirI family transcriptional regulator, nitrous oxide reductase regulator